MEINCWINIWLKYNVNTMSTLVTFYLENNLFTVTSQPVNYWSSDHAASFKKKAKIFIFLSTSVNSASLPTPPQLRDTIYLFLHELQSIHIEEQRACSSHALPTKGIIGVLAAVLDS